jgi:hypothetical protein
MNVQFDGTNLHVWFNAGSQDCDQLFVHVLVVVLNVEDHDRFARQRMLVFFLKPLLVAFFHHEDQLSPMNEFFCNLDARVVFCARRFYMVLRFALKDGFSCTTSPSVSAADEKDVHISDGRTDATFKVAGFVFASIGAQVLS